MVSTGDVVGLGLSAECSEFSSLEGVRSLRKGTGHRFLSSRIFRFREDMPLPSRP